jgi:predicted metal-dependent HD superfamily phosphohydrolase
MTSPPPSPGPDYAGAIAYAIGRLRTELPAELRYHDVAHTERDVMPAAVRLGQLSRLTEHDLRLLEVAAAYHEIGQIRTGRDHERIGVEIATTVLPGFRFTAEDIQRIAGMIMATRLPQSPTNGEQALMADADLDSLGREDFLRSSEALWRERRAQGDDIPWSRWLQSQLQFLKSHRYFTRTAQQLRDAGKARNIELLERLIREGAPQPPEGTPPAA